MLRRSEQSLRRDMKMGRLPTGIKRRRRAMGGTTNYEFSQHDLERHLAPRDLKRLQKYIGKKPTLVQETVAPRGVKRCASCDMFRPASKFAHDPHTFDKLNKDCIPCLEKRSKPKATLKKDVAEKRILSQDKTEWAGFYRRKK